MERALNKRQQQYNRTLEAIRSAVDKLVHEIGFDEMRIRDICQEAGISIGTFYHYFESKDELLFDRYHRLNEALLIRYREKWSGMDEIEALQDFVDYMVGYTRSRVREVLAQYVKTVITFYWKWDTKEPDKKREILYLLVQSGIDKHVIRAGYSADALVSLLLNFTNGLSMSCCQKLDWDAEEDQSIELIKLFLNNLRNVQP